MKETLKANIKLKQCKICENLECSDNEKFIDMFSDLSIIADLNFTTGIITVNIPNLSPSLICSSCLIQLRSFADFKRKALESEENFRTRNSKIEKKFWEDERTTFYEEQEIFDDEISSYNPIFFIKEEPEFFSQDSESLNCINFVDENYESDDSVKSAAKIDTQCEKCGKMFKCMQIHSRLYHSSEDGKNEFDERNFCKLLELNSIENGVGLIRLLQNTGAIPEAMRCKKCKNFMKIRKNGNFYKWCCNMIVKANKKAPRRCNYSQSLTSSTFFSGSHLSILQVCMFTELWIQNIPLVFIKEEVEITQKTAIYWSSFCREVCFDALIEKTQTSVGGEEKVVEIYESIFGHRKYNHRKRIEGQWVFGILERDTGNTILVPVDNRDHDTLFPIKQDYILPGTTRVFQKQHF